MTDLEKFGVAAFVLAFLGASYVAAIYAFASVYLVPATVLYLVVAAVLLVRILTEKENR